jgi:beta-aspartyl-peptidase (threonine type)
MMRYGLVVHGGAGSWDAEARVDAVRGVRAAATRARRILAAGGTALDAVIAAVVALEDDPLFNAGTGACLNLDGDAEMDAQVMSGEGLSVGAVAALMHVRNPVLVAQRVMEQTGHVLLVGTGAQRFARAMGFATYDPVTPRAQARWRERRAELGNTVGAVARDAQGRFAAATSTGGVALKLPGRVGDTPVPGAGNYATPAAAASATGHGELILRMLTTKRACDWIERGLGAQAAVDRVLAEMASTVGSDVGLIAVDGEGGPGVAHGTPQMPFACLREGDADLTSGIGIGR